MKKISSSILCVLLSFSVCLSVASCKKNKGSDATSSYGSPNVGNGDNPNNNIDYTADVVKEDDPFYTHEEARLQIPIDTDKELEYFDMDSMPMFLGDYIAIGYNVSYTIPPEVQEKLNAFKYPEEKDQYYDIYDQYWFDGVAIFTSSGEYLYTLLAEDEWFGGVVFILQDGTLGMVQIGMDWEAERFVIDTVLFDDQGEIKEIKPWTDIPEENGSFVLDRQNTSAYTMPDGRIVLISNSGAALLDASGMPVWTYGGYCSESIGNPMYMQGGFVIDGKIYIQVNEYIFVDENFSEMKRYLQEIDITTGQETGDLIPLSDKLPDVLFQGDNACYGIGANGIVKVDLFTGDREAVINWNETDVNYLRIEQESCRMASAEDLYFYQSVYDEKKPENTYLQMLHFHKADTNPHAGKTILHLSANGIYSESLMDCIVEYNRDPDGKARVLTYDLQDDMSDSIPSFQMAEADLAYRVFLDMKSGVGPDIVMNFDNFGEFENEDVLVDLNTFIDGGNGIDRSLYYDNVFRAFETNGKLFQMPLCFTPECLLCDSALSGGNYGWTYSDFLSKLGQISSGKTAFYNMSSKDFLDDMLQADISYFVNYNACEAKFDSQEFKALLEIAKKCEVSRDIEEWLDDMKHDPYMNAITQDISEMTPFHLSGLRWSLGYTSDVNNGNVDYIGLPSSSGTGMSAYANMSIGISSFSSHQEEAWDFIKSLLGTDIMVELARTSGNPANREAVDILSQEDIDFYNEMKNKYPDDPLMWQTRPIDADSAKEYAEILDHVTMKTATYPTIIAIVEEEAASYFAGQKTADDVAKIIQDRVTTVLQEAQ